MTAGSVTFDHVTKAFGATRAVHDVSITFPSHKIIGLIGPNGGGKSTSLKLMAGLMHPSAGSVRVDGLEARRGLCATVAFAPDAGAGYSFFTVAEMIGYYHSVFADFDPKRAEELRSFMDLPAAVRRRCAPPLPDRRRSGLRGGRPSDHRAGWGRTRQQRPEPALPGGAGPR